MFSTLLDFSQKLLDTLSDFAAEMYDFIFSEITVEAFGIETSVFALMFGGAFFVWVLARIIRSII